MLTSAISGEGLEQVGEAIEARLANRRVTLALRVPASDGEGMAWLHRNADVVSKRLASDDSMLVTVRADLGKAERARQRFEEVRTKPRSKRAQA